MGVREHLIGEHAVGVVEGVDDKHRDRPLRVVLKPLAVVPVAHAGYVVGRQVADMIQEAADPHRFVFAAMGDRLIAGGHGIVCVREIELEIQGADAAGELRLQRLLPPVGAILDACLYVVDLLERPVFSVRVDRAVRLQEDHRHVHSAQHEFRRVLGRRAERQLPWQGGPPPEKGSAQAPSRVDTSESTRRAKPRPRYTSPPAGP